MVSLMASGWKRPLQLAGFCWVAFGVVLAVAYALPFARWADGWAVEGFLNLQSPRLDRLATHVAKLADPMPFAIATIALATVALWRRQPRHALAVIVLLVGANLTTQTLKVLLAHPRPHDFLGNAQIGVDGFPSGHATASMSLAFAAVLVAPTAWRGAVALLGALFALAVSESVMLLAWHFPSDVAGGFLVATASTLTTIACLRAADARWPERSGRDAARRAISTVDGRRATMVVAGFVGAAIMGIAIAAGERTLHFADRHTVAVGAAVVVAAMSALLPAAVASVGARRPAE
jgi:membrane-associated phospholipid phosphatase